MHGFLHEIASNFSSNMKLLGKTIEIMSQVQADVTSNCDIVTPTSFPVTFEEGQCL